MERFEPIEIEVITFASEDVIATSGGDIILEPTP